MVVMQSTVIIALTILGIVFLILSMHRVSRIMRLLNDNVYPFKTWIVVMMMLIGFLAGYSFLVLDSTGTFELPIPLELIVALVYFFGSIFTVVTTGIVNSNLVGILGQRITKEEALLRFISFTDLDPVRANRELDLTQQYEFICQHCKLPVNYTITDIVRSNVVALDRGIAVEDIFGTKSYILRPSHKCVDGRRETTIVHDKNLEIRSIEGSRIIFGGEIS